ncbi:unknownprotein [Zostera marina]|uniref:Transmembrane protein n=1 Tax=Zostera marina TaxID=29655 RepID=A0A0K9PG89_ZOSMR|nr:unknownprotein [Zostera marina]
MEKNSGRKFGGGRKPTGTPSMAWSLVSVVVSLLAGASIVHNIYKPNLALPSTADEDADTGVGEEKKSSR